jgi:hypothetical protein
VDDHVRGRGPRDRRRDHLVARPDAERLEGEVERSGAGAYPDAVTRLAVRGELLLELRDLLAEDVLRRRHGREERIVDRPPVAHCCAQPEARRQHEQNDDYQVEYFNHESASSNCTSDTKDLPAVRVSSETPRPFD